MSKKINNGVFSNLASDIPASIVVFLIAMPLCLGIALASGAPLFAGIISGVIGGMVVGALSGSPLGVSGPAAGLAAVVLASITELGTFEAFLLAGVIAGAIQLIFGLLKAGVIGYYFPSSVIKGMLAGIGITIILKEIPHAVGYDKDPIGDEEFFQVDGHNTFSELGYMLDKVHWSAVIIAVISIAILILWDQKFMKKMKIFQLIQGPLVVVVLGILLNFLFNGMPGFHLEPEHLVNIPVADSIGGFMSQFSMPDFSQWQNPQIYLVALTIAVVASLETLLCVEATDKLDPQKRITPTNRELIAQGSGNMISSFIGGLPLTQVIVRSSANIQSGGRTKMSAILHGVLLMISAILIPGVINLIPLSTLAAILIVVGYKLAKPAIFKEMFSQGISQYLPFVVTILGIIFKDMLVGISLGLIVAFFQILWNNFKTPYHFDVAKYNPNEPVRIELSEDVSFLNKASILKTLDIIPTKAHVIIDGTRARDIHPDIIEIVDDFVFKAKNRDIKVEVFGFDVKAKSKVAAH